MSKNRSGSSSATPAIFTLPSAARTAAPSAAGPDLRLQMALRNVGAVADAQARGALPRASGKVVAKTQARASEPKVADPARALARRDWILAAMEEQRALAAGGLTIPRLDGICRDEFLDRFYAPGRPVILRGALAGWPALDRWTPAYLREVIGDAEVEVQAGRSANPDFEYGKDALRRRMPFSAFIDRVESETGNDIYLTASNNAANAAALAPLHADMRYLPDYLTDAHGMLWIGPAGTLTPLHFDLTNNMMAQIVGRKRVILLPPSETAKLAHNRAVFSDVKDLEDQRALKTVPSAREATRHEIVLEPGEALYIPIGWWHQVRALDFSVTMTSTNFHWRNDWYQSYA